MKRKSLNQIETEVDEIIRFLKSARLPNGKTAWESTFGEVAAYADYLIAADKLFTALGDKVERAMERSK